MSAAMNMGEESQCALVSLQILQVACGSAGNSHSLFLRGSWQRAAISGRMVVIKMWPIEVKHVLKGKRGRNKLNQVTRLRDKCQA